MTGKFSDGKSRAKGAAGGEPSGELVLIRGIGEPVELLGGAVLFSMNDGSRLVPCTVSAAALRVDGGSADLPLIAFMTARDRFEAVAPTKYFARALDPDGGLTIRPDDMKQG